MPLDPELTQFASQKSINILSAPEISIWRTTNRLRKSSRSQHLQNTRRREAQALQLMRLDRHLRYRKARNQQRTGSDQRLVCSTKQTENNFVNLRADILNRLIWDESYDSTDFVIGYEDRFEGRMEASLNSWKREFTEEEFIPQHRILYIKRKSDSEIVWDRRRRIDQIFRSGNSAFDYLAFLA